MKPKLILCLALVAINLSLHARAVRLWSDAQLLEASDLVLIGQPITHEQNSTNVLSTLHVGMTIGDVDQDLGRDGGMRVFTVSSAVRHRYHYFFIPDMKDITLQFDEHDKLVSWEAAKKI